MIRSGSSPQTNHAADAGRGALGLVLVSAAMLALACEAKSRASPLRIQTRPIESAARSALVTVRPVRTQAPCPAEMALVGTVCVDRYEGHLVMADSPEIAHPAYERPVPGERYLARASAGVLPQGYVSRDEASAACRNASKRLCTAQEWRQACRGTKRTLYPYGPEEIPRRCNTGKVHLPSLLFGIHSHLVDGEAHYNSPRLNQEPGFLGKCGEYAGCVNDYGIYDMVGNLHEWVSDLVGGTPHARGRAVFMGGFFSTTSDQGQGCKYVSSHHAPGYHDYSTGFRCCRDAQSH